VRKRVRFNHSEQGVAAKYDFPEFAAPEKTAERDFCHAPRDINRFQEIEVGKGVRVEVQQGGYRRKSDRLEMRKRYCPVSSKDCQHIPGEGPDIRENEKSGRVEKIPLHSACCKKTFGFETAPICWMPAEKEKNVATTGFSMEFCLTLDRHIFRGRDVAVKQRGLHWKMTCSRSVKK
jgi:hypothetical protein